jgi:hypothetical protein
MTTESRYIGCTLGLAVGDALGYPVEFERSPHVTGMSSPRYSDDTQVSTFTVQGILKGGSTEDVHRAYNAGGHLPDPRNDRSEGRVALLPAEGMVTMNPETAARAATLVGAQVAVPMHYASCRSPAASVRSSPRPGLLSPSFTRSLS